MQADYTEVIKSPPAGTLAADRSEPVTASSSPTMARPPSTAPIGEPRSARLADWVQPPFRSPGPSRAPQWGMDLSASRRPHTNLRGAPAPQKL